MTTKEIGSIIGQSDDYITWILQKNGYIDNFNIIDISPSAIIYSLFNEIIECRDAYKDIVRIQKEIIELKTNTIDILKPSLSSVKDEPVIYRQDKKTKTNGFVYIAKQRNETCIYKIGKTENITQREKTFKTGNAYIDIIASTQSNNPYKLEKILHNQLAGKRLTGEWFELNTDEIEWIINAYGFVRQI